MSQPERVVRDGPRRLRTASSPHRMTAIRHQGGGTMAESRIRKLGWMAALTLVAAGGLAACGDQDATDTATASAARVEAARGSDQHLYNQAAEIANRSAVNGSDQHLYNQAAEIAATSAVNVSDQHLYNQAAEIAAASAVNGSDQHLYNQAAEIPQAQSRAESGTAAVATDDATPNALEAGNRAAAAALGQG